MSLLFSVWILLVLGCFWKGHWENLQTFFRQKMVCLHGWKGWFGHLLWFFLLFLFGKPKFLEVRWPWLSLFFLPSQTSVSALSPSSLSYLAFLWMPGGLGSHSQECPLVQEAITAIKLPWQLLSHFIFAIPSPWLPCDFWQKLWLLSNKTWICESCCWWENEMRAY